MVEMTIESLHVKNVRLFTGLNIRFNPKFNFLAGPNGCGKTSALACISHCFSVSSLEYSRFVESSEIWTDISCNQKEYRLGFSEPPFNSYEYRQKAVVKYVNPPSKNGRDVIFPTENVKGILKTLPLFIGAQRNISYSKIGGVAREPPPEEALNQYYQLNTKRLYGEWQTNIKQWIINRYFMIDKDWAAQEKQNWDHFINQLPKIAPFNSNFSYVKTGRDFEPIFSVYGKECYLEELSAGYQAVLSLIIDIFAWVEGTMEGESRIAVNAKGTVLIDEPDVHLHPEWQLTLREGLVNLFPNLQFIVTTHSLHLLASAGPGEVIIMPKAYTEPVYALFPRAKAFSGWLTDDILREIMGVESLDNNERSKLVKTSYDAIDSENIDGLKIAIDELKQICHPNDTLVTELTLELASLQALNGGGKND
jgi:energy-coupling factor transporter ATP-binding protein EcfA2